MTWRAEPTHGCDEALRPRGKAARGPREAQVARTRGKWPRGSTRTPVRGATWQSRGWRVKGPRVSGPWLEYWGGNAVALNCPYFCAGFSSFSSVWDYVPTDFSFAGDVDAR